MSDELKSTGFCSSLITHYSSLITHHFPAACHYFIAAVNLASLFSNRHDDEETRFSPDIRAPQRRRVRLDARTPGARTLE
jgi:hypothetical protein